MYSIVFVIKEQTGPLSDTWPALNGKLFRSENHAINSMANNPLRYDVKEAFCRRWTGTMGLTKITKLATKYCGGAISLGSLLIWRKIESKRSLTMMAFRSLPVPGFRLNVRRCWQKSLNNEGDEG